MRIAYNTNLQGLCMDTTIIEKNVKYLAQKDTKYFDDILFKTRKYKDKYLMKI